jgi:hypothetical protein
MPDCGGDETRQAIDAAAWALAEWSATPASARAVLLRRVAAQVVEERERRATVLTLEQGKPIEEARGDIAYAAGLLVRSVWRRQAGRAGLPGWRGGDRGVPGVQVRIIGRLNIRPGAGPFRRPASNINPRHS